MNKISATSRGWLAFFSLIEAVLLVVFAVGLGMTLTFGTPQKVAAELTQNPSRGLITKAVNRDLNQVAPVSLSAQTVAKLTRQVVFASADFKRNVDVTTVQAPAAVKTHLTQEIKLMMQSGWGAAYGMIVLMMQTATIVAGILGAIILFLMRMSAHSWRRFLRVSGRLAYIIGIFGGIGAIGAGMPAFTANLSFGGAPIGVFAQLIQAFAPLWQRVAGIVIVIGLALAGISYLLSKPVSK